MASNRALLFGRGIKVLFILAGFFLLFSAIFLIKPENYGDGSEYNLMLQSLRSDLRANLEQKDIDYLRTKSEEYNFDTDIFYPENARKGYFTGNDGKNYSYHFWIYPLISIPARILLEVLNQDIFRVFQVTNTIIFLAASFYIYKSIDSERRWLKMFVLLANSSIWFIHWNHPEYFSFAFVLISLVLFMQRKYSGAILLSALASTQNPPILFLSAGILIWNFLEGIIEKKPIEKIVKNFIINGLFALPSLAPFIFYYINFGTFNLIGSVGGANFSMISVKRILELFFDPNLGVLFFSPIAILGIFLSFLSIFVRKIPKYQKFEFIFLILVVILMAGLSASTTNWNHSSTGPSRYAIWSIIPIGSFLLCEVISILKPRKIFEIGIWLLLAYQIIILIIAGGFVPNGRFGAYGMTPFAQVILDKVPGNYNPSQQIFEARVLCDEKVCEKPIIYRVNNQCKKALGINDDATKEFLQTNCDKTFKIDYCFNNSCYYSFL